MTLTLKAILARFNGDRGKAIEYCTRVAETPRLKDEYLALADALRQKGDKQ